MKKGDKVIVADRQSFLFNAKGTIIEVDGARILVEFNNIRKMFSVIQLQVFNKQV